MRKISGPNTDPCATPALIDSELEDYHSYRLFDVYYGGMIQSIREHSCLSIVFKFV